MKRALMLTATVLLTQPAQSTEATVTLRATVTGNQEQPRVMYIVPWQEPGSPQPGLRRERDLVGDLFSPLHRNDFRRQLRYRELLQDYSPSSGDERATTDRP